MKIELKIQQKLERYMNLNKNFNELKLTIRNVFVNWKINTNLKLILEMLKTVFQI